MLYEPVAHEHNVSSVEEEIMMKLDSLRSRVCRRRLQNSTVSSLNVANPTCFRRVASPTVNHLMSDLKTEVCLTERPPTGLG